MDEPRDQKISERGISSPLVGYAIMAHIRDHEAGEEKQTSPFRRDLDAHPTFPRRR